LAKCAGVTTNKEKYQQDLFHPAKKRKVYDLMPAIVCENGCIFLFETC